jgi:hypothetical protein
LNKKTLLETGEFFYLSKGYKEDSHSEWIRIGKEQTKGSNLDPGETYLEFNH